MRWTCHARADIKANLIRLNEDMVRALHDLMDALEKTPSESARQVEDVLAVQNNLMHLCNTLRPVQARATLRHMLEKSAEQKRELIQKLQADSEAAESAIRTACKECSKICN
jgi:hypothetical protein